LALGYHIVGATGQTFAIPVILISVSLLVQESLFCLKALSYVTAQVRLRRTLRAASHVGSANPMSLDCSAFTSNADLKRCKLTLVTGLMRLLRHNPLVLCPGLS
jgi:hypothetical protein